MKRKVKYRYINFLSFHDGPISSDSFAKIPICESWNCKSCGNCSNENNFYNYDSNFKNESLKYYSFGDA